jgi:GxxExxY protein
MEETKSETKKDLKNNFFHKIFEYSKEIHKKLGSGYKEHIYVSAMKYHLTHDQYNFQTEVIIPIIYKNIQLGYERADIIIYEPYPCVLEFKAQNSQLSRKEFIQLEKYLKNMSINYGILINFHINNSFEFYLIERICKESESKESESKEVESKEVESKEVESKEVESKEVESKEVERIKGENERKKVVKEKQEDIELEEIQEEFIYKNFTDIGNLMKSIKIN